MSGFKESGGNFAHLETIPLMSKISTNVSETSRNSDVRVDRDTLQTTTKLTTQMSNVSLLSQTQKNLVERSVTHFGNMEKQITRMPQFYKADEFVRCLSRFTMEKESLAELSRLSKKFNTSDSDVRYEIIIENQRGATLFGSKFYSKESVLYPLDPPKYQTLTGKNLINLSMYPEPASNWKWSWNSWHVMMINDVDEDGWIYSNIRFGSYHWTGVGKFGNFVRRRIWIRMIERIKSSYGELNGSDDDSEVEEVLEILPNYKDLKDFKGSKIKESKKIEKKAPSSKQNKPKEENKVTQTFNSEDAESITPYSG